MKITKKELAEVLDLSDCAIERIFKQIKHNRTKLPTIELSGLNPAINYVAMDEDNSVYLFWREPRIKGNYWESELGASNTSSFDKSLFHKVTQCDWDKSLHKVKHV